MVLVESFPGDLVIPGSAWEHVVQVGLSRPGPEYFQKQTYSANEQDRQHLHVAPNANRLQAKDLLSQRGKGKD